MFEKKNDDVTRTNAIISSYTVLLELMKKKEQLAILQKRKEEYERIRPPVEKWWELKGKEFTEEFIRNGYVMTANPSYFKKLERLHDKELY